MRNQLALLGVAMTMAFSMGGCAVAADGDEAAMDEAKSEESTNEFAYVDEAQEQTVDKAEKEAPLTVKGAWSESRSMGKIYHKYINVPQGQTLTCSTSNGSTGVDTVLSIIRCWGATDGTGDMWNKACWPGEGGDSYKTYGYNTLAFNDDISWPSNSYSQVSYTGTTYGGDNVYVVGFGYGNSVGTATVTCNMGNVNETGSFWAGSNQRSCDQGKISFTSGGDTVLLGIDPNINGGDTRQNDDISGSNRLSSVANLPSAALWYVHGYYYDGTGTSNLSCAQ